MDIRAVSFLGGHLDGLAHEESSILGAYLLSSIGLYNAYQMYNIQIQHWTSEKACTLVTLVQAGQACAAPLILCLICLCMYQVCGA